MLLRAIPVSIVLLATMTLVASAHDGRKLRIEIVDGKLQGQGENTGADDGADPIRPFKNSIHDHWANFELDTGSGLEPYATSFLPEFTVPIDVSFVRLNDHHLQMHLDSVTKWVNPPMMPNSSTVPELVALDPSEVITIESSYGSVNSDSLGALTLSPSIPSDGIPEVLMNYHIDGHPSGVIHVMKFHLSAEPNASGVADLVADSDPMYILLSPAGDTPQIRLHHASLFLESYLATHVPEPSSVVLVVLGIAGAIGARRWWRV